jgi:hypothetical protein
MMLIVVGVAGPRFECIAPICQYSAHQAGRGFEQLTLWMRRNDRTRTRLTFISPQSGNHRC